MVMKKVHKNCKDVSPILKPMNQMKKGEVCFIPANGQFILKVGYLGYTPTFLVLDSTEEINMYGPGCPLEVRELYEGESVTIEFK